MTGELLARLLEPTPLAHGEVLRTFDALTSSEAIDEDRAAVLVALAGRRAPPTELAAFAREMRRRAVPFPIPARDDAIDLCGSGGAIRPSYNVSTVSAFVVRAAGVRVAKHGNRSRRVCGSSDLLEALGLPVTTSIPFARASYRRHGIAFLHAPLFHPATRAVAAVRKRLGIPTIFNRLGPLSNPARVRCKVSGVSDVGLLEPTAEVLGVLGVTHGAVMSSDDGCDEFSPSAPTTALVWTASRRRRLRFSPVRFLPRDDRVGSWGALPPAKAAEEAERILAGGGGARRGSVLLTSGCALWVSGKARDLDGGIALARDALDRGAAEELLADLRSLAARFPRTQES
jgi:anthranilate phosphoribosyltransferase